MPGENANDAYYDELYRNNHHIWGEQPCITLERTWPLFQKDKPVLDLGCGQGRNAFFLAEKGFHVVAVDASVEATVQLREESTRRRLPISVVCAEILDYPIREKYGVVSLINVISFWKRQEGLAYLEALKKSVCLGTHLVITGLLKDDAFFQERPDGLFFEKGELLRLFSDFENCFYQEDRIMEGPHEGYPYPHEHAFARFVGKKTR